MALAQLARASPLQGEGRGFESLNAHHWFSHQKVGQFHCRFSFGNISGLNLKVISSLPGLVKEQNVGIATNRLPGQILHRCCQKLLPLHLNLD
jgi:hypothetical protein